MLKAEIEQVHEIARQIAKEEIQAAMRVFREEMNKIKAPKIDVEAPISKSDKGGTK